MVLWELFGVWNAFNVLAIVIQDVDGLLLEQGRNFFILIDHVPQIAKALFEENYVSLKSGSKVLSLILVSVSYTHLTLPTKRIV